MNRLVIIGNGFDLAHGLPTSYKHFIDDYWKQVCDTKGEKRLKCEDEFIALNCEFGSPIDVDEFNVIDKLKDYSELKGFIERNKQNSLSGEFSLVFNNKFFQKICDNLIKNWVDIENLYYLILKQKAKGDFRKYNYPWDVSQLNEEFEQVKNLLEKYLNKIDKNKVINKSILNHFELVKINVEKYLLEFSKQDKKEIEDFQNEYIREKEKGKDIITLCLNFNYTQTIDDYIDATMQYGKYRDYGQFENVQIHGRLNDENNKINFGFGDEMDDEYKMIENLDDNEYLKNFKSFQYLQNSNYKKFLDFIDGSKFQVFIMGHSCGLSDRTLLNTVFEHKYCRSIKVFYHQREDGTDNYTEIVQNISRHFNNKKLMREKIVNKMFCEPLLKIQLPLK